MIADIAPDIDVAVDECQPISGNVKTAIAVVRWKVWCAGDGIEVAVGKSPGAPLLRVVHLKDAGDERRASRRGDLVEAVLSAHTVQIATACPPSTWQVSMARHLLLLEHLRMRHSALVGSPICHCCAPCAKYAHLSCAGGPS